MVKVLLVDDQRLFTDGILAILAETDDIQVVGVATNGKEAIAKFQQYEPDLALMDIHMPHVNGIRATLDIKERYPDVKVILLTTFADEDLIVRGFNVGADGYLLKDLNGEKLIWAIREAERGEMVISGPVARILAKKIREYKYDKKEILRQKLATLEVVLTPRELEIAYMLMEEETNKSIAQKLYLSEGTIKNYISDLYHKLNIHSRKRVIDFLKGLFSKKEYW
ncbi:response regulator [Virgibacillus halodenitrificans]|uniref:Response regulator transcription factor n=1 Tax=Virgibacillus halodenitrificans TaxID=1482 RepID=A0ABR7VJ94_VIRHA|nr:response regulator transcription factor [Virgibacillus halodenitrificans]MBD1221315.1 response regulator transcription factor [Virgibacillus halodenitrificans]